MYKGFFGCRTICESIPHLWDLTLHYSYKWYLSADDEADMYIEKIVGPSKVLWEGHLEEDASVLPQDKQQISEFFTNAARAINTRGKLMTDALKSKL